MSISGELKKEEEEFLALLVEQSDLRSIVETLAEIAMERARRESHPSKADLWIRAAHRLKDAANGMQV